MDKFFEKQTVAYFAKAILLVVCLMLVSWVAPILPSVFLPLIFMAYAVVSTIGALYYTVINRLHRQKKLADTGKLSKLNRKWVWRMVGILIVAIFSGFFFVLESPKWDMFEWLLIWIAVPLYFVVFQFTQRYLKREYAPKFYKAHAMRWSFWIVGAILCVAYAALSSLLPSPDYETLSAAFDAVQEPYKSAPSAVMSEAEKISSFTDGLTAYGMSQLSDSVAIAGFVVKIVTYASVFFGLVSQFGFCLLNANEIKSEFQILPPHDEDDSSGPILPRYVIAVAVVTVIAYASFLCAEFELAKAQATDDLTAMEQLINEQKERLIDIADGVYAEMKEHQAQEEASIQAAHALLAERNDQLSPLINSYYDQCLDNIDAYVDWYYGPAGTLAKLMKPLGNPMSGTAKDAFLKEIATNADDDVIEETYAEYQEKIRVLKEQSSAVLTAAEIDVLFNGTDSNSIDLWAPLEESANVDDVLLNTEEGMSREGLQEKIRQLIGQAREESLSMIRYNDIDNTTE